MKYVRNRWLPWSVLGVALLALQGMRPANTFLGINELNAAEGNGSTNWVHWRGPLQTGFSVETNLPDEWDPRTVGKNNLVWKQPYGCRSTPMVMNGRVYIIGADNEPPGVPTAKEKPLIGERVVCFDAKKGDKIWEQQFNVFHTDIVANRLGWAPLSGDPENKRVYAHSTAGFLFCFDAETGKIIWQRELTEEFGRVTGYGGRLGSGPTYDSGLVIVGIANSNWGNQGGGLNRFFAFDAKDGRVVWMSDTPAPLRLTYSSNPVVAVIKGERLLITGGADGGLHAFQVRTGRRVWSYMCAAGIINPSPVVDGNLVYVSHGEENLDGGGLGRVVCVDGSKVVNGKPTLVWEYKKATRFGLGSLALAYGKVYVPDDGAKLHCFDAKKGKWLGKIGYGTVARGAPLVADHKIYISETNGKFCIIKLNKDGTLKLDDNGDEQDEADKFTTYFKPKPGAEGTVESNCTPSVADGRVYIATRDELYCISTGEKGKTPAWPEQPKEAPNEDSKVAQLQVVPAEVELAPGATQEFELRAFNAKGQLIKDAKLDATWSMPIPPPPKGAKNSPPALDATLDIASGKITVNPKKPSQQGYLDATVGMLTARSRVRVVPQIPYNQDFEKVPVGAVPAGWINAQGKYRVVMDGNDKVLFKVNNNARPPVARALAYITLPNTTGYTIEADMKGMPARGRLGDMGVCANRYLLIMDGKGTVRITTWEALPEPLPHGRVAKVENFGWKPGVWYRVKLTVDVGDKSAVVRGKVWERGKAEPADWTIEVNDPRPNREGAAALYGYVPNVGEATDGTVAPGAEIYFDNIAISHNKK